TIAEHRQRAGLLGRKTEHARRIAHGAPPAPGDVLADHRGVFAAVTFVHVLQDAFAIAVREVDVDVGGFLALFTQEALEQQFELDRIYRSYSQHVADGAVGGGAAALAEDTV